METRYCFTESQLSYALSSTIGMFFEQRDQYEKDETTASLLAVGETMDGLKAAHELHAHGELETARAYVCHTPALLDALKALLMVAPTSDGLRTLLDAAGSHPSLAEPATAEYRAARLAAETLVRDLTSEVP